MSSSPKTTKLVQDIVRAMHDLTKSHYSSRWVSTETVLAVIGVAHCHEVDEAIQQAVDANLLGAGGGPSPDGLCVTIDGLMLIETFS